MSVTLNVTNRIKSLVLPLSSFRNITDAFPIEKNRETNIFKTKINTLNTNFVINNHIYEYHISNKMGFI
jgi:hypothetical protein